MSADRGTRFPQPSSLWKFLRRVHEWWLTTGSSGMCEEPVVRMPRSAEASREVSAALYPDRDCCWIGDPCPIHNPVKKNHVDPLWRDLAEAALQADGERLADIGDWINKGVPVENEPTIVSDCPVHGVTPGGANV